MCECGKNCNSDCISQIEEYQQSKEFKEQEEKFQKEMLSAKIDYLFDKKITYREWVSVLGDTTCKFCEGLDGQIATSTSKFRQTGSNGKTYLLSSPPAHKNCKCKLKITKQ